MLLRVIGGKHGYAKIEDIELFAGLRLGQELDMELSLASRGAAELHRFLPGSPRAYALTASGQQYLQIQLTTLVSLLEIASRRLTGRVKHEATFSVSNSHSVAGDKE